MIHPLTFFFCASTSLLSSSDAQACTETFAVLRAAVATSILSNVAPAYGNSEELEGVDPHGDPMPRPSGGSEIGKARSLDPVIQESESDPGPNPQIATPRGDPGDSPAPRIGFNGVIGTPVTLIPPDTHLAVGPGVGGDGRIVMVTNEYVKLWNKNGVTLAGPKFLDSMLLPATEFCFDPKVLFDPHSGRFFIVALEGAYYTSEISRLHIAVSTSDTPNNLDSDWIVMSGNALEIIDGEATWFDYPGIGSDDDSLFVTGNLFTFSSVTYMGVKIRVFDTQQLLAGNYAYTDLVIDVISEPTIRTLQPAHTSGATADGAFYLISRYSSTQYKLVRVDGDPADPTILSDALYSWEGGSYPADEGADQLGSTIDLDTSPGRAMNAVYRGSHLWTCMTSDPDDDGETEVVWQDILISDGVPSISQHGTIQGTGVDSWTHTCSIAVNEAGDAAVCFTQSSTSEYPGVYYAVRGMSDPKNTFRTPIAALTGSGYYDSYLSDTIDRWGDYSAAVVDPGDDCFWVANEFAFTSQINNSKWGTYIASFCIDCNANGVPDAEDIANGTSSDCTQNGVPDECDLAQGTSDDCTSDGIPDECQPDCDSDGIGDVCELSDCEAGDFSCQDCNANLIPDRCDVDGGASGDINGNFIPDECEDACLTQADCDDGIACTFDICGASLTCVHITVLCDCLSDLDCSDSDPCNGDEVCDPELSCQTLIEDCNANDQQDGCDIDAGISLDINNNLVPDECETLPCGGDANGDGQVDPLDSGSVLARFGCPVGQGDSLCDAADTNADGIVDPLDVGFVLARFGECPGG